MHRLQGSTAGLHPQPEATVQCVVELIRTEIGKYKRSYRDLDPTYLIHASISEEQSGVIMWHNTRAWHIRMAAFQEVVYEHSADLS